MNTTTSPKYIKTAQYIDINTEAFKSSEHGYDWNEIDQLKYTLCEIGYESNGLNKAWSYKLVLNKLSSNSHQVIEALLKKNMIKVTKWRIITQFADLPEACTPVRTACGAWIQSMAAVK